MTEQPTNETPLDDASSKQYLYKEPLENSLKSEEIDISSSEITETTPNEPSIVNTQTPTPREPWRLSFFGEGTKYFVIKLINALLQIITLNFYYPWAKAAKLSYLYEQTEFAGSRFKFHGTGKELLMGYLKMLLIAAILYGAFYWLQGNYLYFLGFAVLYGGLILIYPLAIHGTAKYRLSRSSWRGIFFGYRGKLGELFSKFFIGMLLTIVSFGIYFSWVQVDIRKYVTQNIRFGNTEFDFVGTGGDLLLLKIKYMAFFLIAYVASFFLIMLLTLFGVGMGSIFDRTNPYALTTMSVGVVMLVFAMILIVAGLFVTIYLMRQRELFQFYANNTVAWQNDQWHRVNLEMTLGDMFKLSFVNMLLLIFTFGIAAPFVEIRNLHFMLPRLSIEGTFDPNSLVQTESNYNDAMGEDVGDWLDLDLA